VTVDSDAVPGVFHEAASVRSVVEAILQNTIGHYTPSVELSRVPVS